MAEQKIMWCNSFTSKFWEKKLYKNLLGFVSRTYLHTCAKLQNTCKTKKPNKKKNKNIPSASFTKRLISQGHWDTKIYGRQKEENTKKCQQSGDWKNYPETVSYPEIAGWGPAEVNGVFWELGTSFSSACSAAAAVLNLLSEQWLDTEKINDLWSSGLVTASRQLDLDNEWLHKKKKSVSRLNINMLLSVGPHRSVTYHHVDVHSLCCVSTGTARHIYDHGPSHKQ